VQQSPADVLSLGGRPDCLLRRPLVLVAFAAFLGLGFLAFTALNIEVYPDPARTVSIVRLPPVRFVRESRRRSAKRPRV